MSTVGPVCHIPPDTGTIDQPGPQNLPAIPPAQPNLASLTATVNAMRQLLLLLTGQQGTQGRQGAAGKDGKNTEAKGTWTELDRTTSTVRIYQNNDPSTGNFVEVEQINALTMTNKDTKQTWKWDRDRA